MRRAEKGDETAFPALREVLKEALKDPAAADLFGGDLAARAQQALIHKYSGKNPLLEEPLTRKVELLRSELAGPEPAPLERLLAERVVSCWLHLHYLELVHAQKDGIALELDMHYQKCLDRAHRRYLSAIKALAVVRKLALPVLSPAAGAATAPKPSRATRPPLPVPLAERLAGAALETNGTLRN
jgi:hypothetical protein